MGTSITILDKEYKNKVITPQVVERIASDIFSMPTIEELEQGLADKEEAYK